MPHAAFFFFFVQMPQDKTITVVKSFPLRGANFGSHHESHLKCECLTVENTITFIVNLNANIPRNISPLIRTFWYSHTFPYISKTTNGHISQFVWAPCAVTKYTVLPQRNENLVITTVRYKRSPVITNLWKNN